MMKSKYAHLLFNMEIKKTDIVKTILPESIKNGKAKTEQSNLYGAVWLAPKSDWKYHWNKNIMAKKKIIKYIKE